VLYRSTIGIGVDNRFVDISCMCKIRIMIFRRTLIKAGEESKICAEKWTKL